MPAGAWRSRDELAGLLWGDLDDARAQDNLRHELARLRKALGKAAGLVLADSRGLALNAARTEVDVPQFEALLDKSKLPDAVALYRGDVLTGFVTKEAPFDDWVRERALDAFDRLVAQQARAPTAARRSPPRAACSRSIPSASPRTAR